MFTEHMGKYSKSEFERRFLVETPPGDLAGGWRITDRYLTGTRLRLRRMDKADGSTTIYKLGQKYRSPDQEAIEATMTTIYLNAEEYERLSALDGAELVKQRFGYEENGVHFSLDIFEGDLEGLVLVEIEHQDPRSLSKIKPPDTSWIEVTDEPFFSGHPLAELTREAFQSGLQRWKEAQGRTSFTG